MCSTFVMHEKKKRESYQKNKELISDMQPQEKGICGAIWKRRKQNIYSLLNLSIGFKMKYSLHYLKIY